MPQLVRTSPIGKVERPLRAGIAKGRPLAALAAALLLCSCGGGADAAQADAGLPDAASPDATPPDAAAPVCVTGAGGFPRPLSLPEPQANGDFDPNLVRDPATDRLWMSYSSMQGPAGIAEVSIRLAYSDDDGETWCVEGMIAEASQVPEDEQPTAIATAKAHWSHETSAIAYDPSAPAESRWIVVWHRYLHVEDGVPGNEDRHFEHGWIAQRKAATPLALLTASEEKLFSAAAYHSSATVESYNDRAPGGEPEKSWVGDDALGNCIALAEPGMATANGKLYLASYCYRSADQQDIVLLERSAGVWSHAGTLLTTADAKAINPALLGFNGADIVEFNGGHRLLVSGTAGAGYLGCIEYQLDLSTATLSDLGGDGPAALSAYPASTDPDVILTGACTYDENSDLGLIVGEIHATGVQLRLFATGRALTNSP